MNNQEKIDVGEIAKHVSVLNHEVGEMKKIQLIQQVDIKWIKRVVYYLAGAISLGIGKVVLFGG